MIHGRLVRPENECDNDITIVNKVKVFNSKAYYDIMDIPFTSQFKQDIMSSLSKAKIALFFVTELDSSVNCEDLLFEILSTDNLLSDNSYIVIAFAQGQKVFNQAVLYQKEVKVLTKGLDEKLTLKHKENYKRVKFVECWNKENFKDLSKLIINILS